MKLTRLFSSEKYKGEKNYLNNQRVYEILRTVLFFALSAAVYLIGFFTTHTNKNLLTVVAVLGCLPAAKSAVSMIMFIRYRTYDKALSDEFESAGEGLVQSFDNVFTSYDKNFRVEHLAVHGGCIIAYAFKTDFPETDFANHINKYLKAENYKDLTIKVFTDKKKYLERLESIKQTSTVGNEEGILQVLHSISL